MDTRGAQYQVVEDPDLVDEFGNIVSNKEGIDVVERQPEIPMTVYKTACLVYKVPTDRMEDGLYRLRPKLGGTFFKCLDPIARELTEEKYLYMIEDLSQSGNHSLIVDKYKKRYCKAA